MEKEGFCHFNIRITATRAYNTLKNREIGSFISRIDKAKEIIKEDVGGYIKERQNPEGAYFQTEYHLGLNSQGITDLISSLYGSMSDSVHQCVLIQKTGEGKRIAKFQQNQWLEVKETALSLDDGEEFYYFIPKEDSICEVALAKIQRRGNTFRQESQILPKMTEEEAGSLLLEIAKNRQIKSLKNGDGSLLFKAIIGRQENSLDFRKNLPEILGQTKTPDFLNQTPQRVYKLPIKKWFPKETPLPVYLFLIPPAPILLEGGFSSLQSPNENSDIAFDREEIPVLNPIREEKPVISKGIEAEKILNPAQSETVIFEYNSQVILQPSQGVERCVPLRGEGESTVSRIAGESVFLKERTEGESLIKVASIKGNWLLVKETTHSSQRVLREVEIKINHLPEIISKKPNSNPLFLIAEDRLACWTDEGVKNVFTKPARIPRSLLSGSSFNPLPKTVSRNTQLEITSISKRGSEKPIQLNQASMRVTERGKPRVIFSFPVRQKEEVIFNGVVKNETENFQSLPSTKINVNNPRLVEREKSTEPKGVKEQLPGTLPAIRESTAVVEKKEEKGDFQIEETERVNWKVFLRPVTVTETPGTILLKNQELRKPKSQEKLKREIGFPLPIFFEVESIKEPNNIFKPTYGVILFYQALIYLCFNQILISAALYYLRWFFCELRQETHSLPCLEGELF